MSRCLKVKKWTVWWIGKTKAPFPKALLLSVGCTTLRLTQGGATQPLYFECPIASNWILLELFCPAVFWFVHSDSLAPCTPETFPSHHSTNLKCVPFSWEDSYLNILGLGMGDAQENLDDSCYTYGIHSYKSKCSLRCGLCSMTFRSVLIWLNSPYKIGPNNFYHDSMKLYMSWSYFPSQQGTQTKDFNFYFYLYIYIPINIFQGFANWMLFVKLICEHYLCFFNYYACKIDFIFLLVIIAFSELYKVENSGI